MNRNKVAIILLSISTLVVLILYINTRDHFKYIQEQDKLRILNYEADEYCLQLALAYCSDEWDKYALFFDEGIEIEPPLSFTNGSRSIKHFKKTKHIAHTNSSPFATYIIDYSVFEATQTEPSIIRQTILIQKDDNNYWTFEILNYRIISSH